jgi:hypothetical protein
MCAIHAFVIHISPFEPMFDEFGEMSTFVTEFFPATHKHLECRYSTRQYGCCFARHDLLNVVRDLMLYYREVRLIYTLDLQLTPTMTSKSRNTSHSRGVILYLARSLWFGRARK